MANPFKLTVLAVQRPRMAYPMELMQFHSEDYINFLARVTPENQDEMLQQLIQVKIFLRTTDSAS